MKHPIVAIVCLVWMAVCWSACAEERSTFDSQIAPILEQRCLRCHGPEQMKGKLSLASAAGLMAGGESGPAVVSGKPDESLLLDMVSGKEPAMPKQGRALNKQEVAALRQWIADGANWPADRQLLERAPQNLDWWSLQEVRRPELPQVKKKSWPRNAVDYFILARLEKEGLVPSPEADSRTLLRRLKLDLWGLPPAPEEIAAFMVDEDLGAYEKQAHESLKSIHFGERYARHWLDLVRFAETHGFEMNQERPNAWPYRDYVIHAFQQDLPYDRFLQEQLAGDSLGVDEATGFLVAGAWDQVKSPDPVLTANQRADELHDIVSTTSSALLGLTVGCARCHDHKFDPVPQTDYYALKAVFEGVQHGDRELTKEADDDRSQRLARLTRQRDQIAEQLAQYEPLASASRSVVIHPQNATVEQLVPTEGTQPYVEGETRGARGFRGDASQLPTLGKGYFYWQDVAGRDVVAWQPKLEGEHHIWVSWGCGWKTHATDATYLLDRDGDVTTKQDQAEIGKIDQQRFADGSGDPPNQPLWSGLRDLGVHELMPSSKLLLRGGATGDYVAADVVVFEQQASSTGPKSKMPQLRLPVVRGTNVERFPAVECRFMRFTISKTSDVEPCIDELQVFTAGENPRNVALASSGTKATASGTFPNSEIHRLEHIHDERVGNEASWISNESGRGWAQLEFPEAVKIGHITWGRDQSAAPKYEDRLPLEYQIEVSLDGQRWTSVASSHDRLPRGTPVPGGLLLRTMDEQVKRWIAQRTALDKQIVELASPRMVYGGRMSAPGETYRLHRGDPTQPREPVVPGALSTIPIKLDLPPQANEPQRRLALARWITDRRNPLTARVIVNRLWQWHFGEALCDTPSDFGVNGTRPTHPELLEYLAAELLEHDWSLHHIHRLILTSATYRQQSIARPEAAAKDASSRLLWRYPPRRLEAEPLRDCVLAISGSLDLSPAGPGFSPFEPNTNYVRVYTPKTSFAPADFRRMIYMLKVRMQTDPNVGAFDCPDGGQTAPKRTRSTTPLQALALLNSPFFIDQASRFADRLRRDAGEKIGDQVERGFALAYQRAAAADERAAAIEAVEKYGLPVFCRALLNSNEFVSLE